MDVKKIALTVALITLTSIGYADPIGGEETRRDTVSAQGVRVWTRDYQGGEYADVSALADGNDAGCDIDIKVYDASGRLVAEDTDNDGEPFCQWWVSSAYRSRTYTIKVINCEDHAEPYRISFY